LPFGNGTFGSSKPQHVADFQAEKNARGITGMIQQDIQVNVEGRTGGARISVPAWNAVVTAKSEKAGPGL